MGGRVKQHGDQSLERWVSVDVVAAHLGVAKDTVYRWIETRGLPARKVGRLWKCRLGVVDQWVEEGGAAPGAGDPKAAGSGAE